MLRVLVLKNTFLNISLYFEIMTSLHQ